MCGIVAYIGPREAVPVLLGGLQRLEYRGYDSAGVAVPGGDSLLVRKRPGKVAELARAVLDPEAPAPLRAARCGIAHTRWATHGPPTEANAHPHPDRRQRVAVVHNGIIENHRALRGHLEARGCVFRSDTDTEALAHLIGELYTDDLLAAVCAALRQVEGAFGIAVLAADRPDEIIVARRGSPIVIGLCNGETLVASDASALIAHTRQVIYLDDNDIARVRAEGVEVRNLHNAPVVRPPAELDWSAEAAEKGGFAHYMLKEIHDQPDAVRNTLRGRLDLDAGTALLSGLNLSPREMADIRRVLLVGCGTSRHAGMVGEYALEDVTGIPAEVEQAAEFRYRNPLLDPRDLVLAISQSGETADTLAAVREAKRKGALVAGLCNVVGSTIARETGRGVYLHAGPEISVASTKAFTCQVAVLLMVALKMARGRRLSREDGLGIARELDRLPDLIAEVIAENDRIAAVAERFASFGHSFFIGRGYLYPVALEGALKLKEISYQHAEGYHAAELKHGPIALLSPEMPVVALLNRVPGQEKTIGNAHECRARGAPLLGVITRGDAEAQELTEAVIEVPPASAAVTAVLDGVALQLLAYHIARQRGCPIDQPRNLAKSVTVE
jgi:glucosamine--fructose-6-phosphate aminotransferase (isomerizing)